MDNCSVIEMTQMTYVIVSLALSGIFENYDDTLKNP